MAVDPNLTPSVLARPIILNPVSNAKLLGKVTVEPSTVQPGQPVLVQALDPSGKMISDPDINVIIQNGPAASRYLQFGVSGTYQLLVTATKGAVQETAMATITVTGTPMAFRPTLTPPAATQIPMLQVTGILGQPYAANFSLGVTDNVRRIMAEAVVKNLPEASPAGTISKPPTVIKTGTAASAPASAPPTPQATSYLWDFGDGQTETTQTPQVTHDYFPAVKAGDVVRPFDVTCTVQHDNVTVKRTLLLHSGYGISRQMGVIVPPITAGTQFATFQQVGFSASLILHNLEASPLTINSVAYVPFGDDGTYALPAPNFKAMKTPVVVAAGGASVLGAYVPVSGLQTEGTTITGFTMYYSGQMAGAGGKTMPVRCSYAVRIRLGDSGVLKSGPSIQFDPANWDLNAALLAISGASSGPGGSVSAPGGQILDAATNTVAIALSANPSDLNTIMKAQSAVQAGLTGIALKNGALTAKGVVLPLARPVAIQPLAATARPEIARLPVLDAPITTVGAPRAGSPVPPNPPTDPTTPGQLVFDPMNPPPVAAGNECYPDDISDGDAATAAAAQLVCQLTSQTIIATIPAQFQNAQQGDVILSPAPVGTGDLISAMFAQLTPPQHHGHSGIMTMNFLQITHNTASPNRISSNLNTTLGVPTSLNSDLLQYAWPGCLTQSVQDATGSVYLADPGGTAYQFSSFNAGPQGDPFSLTYPLVVKPLPENEVTARPLLRKVADTALSKGAVYEAGGTSETPGKLLHQGGVYYSFYAYTDPQISAGFGDAAGAEAGWAQGLVPGVCSSFVWMCMKANNVPLVTKNQYEQLSDFSPGAQAQGALVGPSTLPTLDGLAFYPAAERAAAGQGLYQLFMEQALSQEGGFGTWFGGDVNTAIAGPLANQLLNMFASGNPNLQTDAWQTPGDANAISPDNIRFWNTPYFGYAEQLQYLPTTVEQYTVSKWVKVVTWGTIKGTVKYNGSPISGAHVWVLDTPGYDTFTAADGSYTLNKIPIGTYALQAQGVVTVSGAQGNVQSSQPVTLTKTDSNVVQNIVLQGLPDTFRQAYITYLPSGDHQSGGTSGGQTTGVQNMGWLTGTVLVNPGNSSNSYSYKFDYNGGGYYNVACTWDVQLQSDNSLMVNFSAVMNSDNSGSDTATPTPNPYSFVVQPGQTFSTGFSGLEYDYSYVLGWWHNGPFNLSFDVTNNQQTG